MSSLSWQIGTVVIGTASYNVLINTDKEYKFSSLRRVLEDLGQ